MHDEDNFRYIGKKVIRLTRSENIILGLLMKNKGNITKYEEISKALGYEKLDESVKKSIIILMCRLRKKLKKELKITTIRTAGYEIEERRNKNEYL